MKLNENIFNVEFKLRIELQIKTYLLRIYLLCKSLEGMLLFSVFLSRTSNKIVYLLSMKYAPPSCTVTRPLNKHTKATFARSGQI